MKKLILLIATMAAIIITLAGCVGAKSGTSVSEGEGIGKLKIVATIFPEYDWVKSILGDEAKNVDLKLLVDNGVDLHSYQPTAEDILTISNCDVFIYVGGESDKWVKDALKDANNKNMTVINLMDILGENAKEEETVEGMESVRGESEEDTKTGETQDEKEYDEHVWLSLKNAKVLTEAIADKLLQKDPGNAATYKENEKQYKKELSDLDAEYKKVVDQAKVKTLLFGDRFPFRYLVDDYGISYYAAFAGCSADSEASFETISFLANKVDELGLKSVITLEGQDKSVANTIIENTKTKDQKVLTLDSMQSITSKDISGGTTYISIMKKNLEVLKQALK